MTTISDLSNPYQGYYKCSEFIDIAQKFREYKDLIGSSAFHEYYEHAGDDASYVARHAIGFEIDAAKYDILVEFCSVDQLTVEGELEKVNKKVYDRANNSRWKPRSFMPDVEKLPLMTLKCAKKLQAASNYTWLMQLKYRTERPIVSFVIVILSLFK